MAKKNVTKSANRQRSRPGSGGLPERKWFSKLLPFLKENEGLTVTQRKKNAERDCRRLLLKQPKGKKWRITKFKWEPPGPKSKKYRLTVMIKRRPGPTSAPGDPPIRTIKTPPPGM